MDTMTAVDGALAFIRLPKGVYRQGSVYRRGAFHYIKHGAGFVRIVSKWDGYWTTTNPDVKVLEVEGVDL